VSIRSQAFVLAPKPERQVVYFLLATATMHRKRKLYISQAHIVGGPTPIYIPLPEAQGRWPSHMVERRML